MTIIVATKIDNKIYMGSDTQLTGGNYKGYCDEKWIKVEINEYGDYCYIGCTGRLEFIDFLKYYFKAPYKEKEQQFDNYLFNNLTPSILEGLQDKQLILKSNEQIDTEGAMIVVYDKIYHIYDNMFPVICQNNFLAEGSGYAYAYGAWKAINDIEKKENINIDNIDKIKICINAANEYNPYCGGEVKTIVKEVKKWE